ncbi:MAG: alpha/beta hydrolase [Anaerolineae bacterium]
MSVRDLFANGVRLCVETWGEGDEPFVLLHGLASTQHMFDLVAPLLADSYYVIAPDQRGHGKSDKPASGYDFDTICADVDGLVEALGLPQPFRLAGHSWGAYSVLRYAATRPERVSKLFLIDGGLVAIRDRAGATWDEAAVRMAPPLYKDRTQADIERMIREDWLGPDFRPELMPLVLSVFDTSDPSQVRAWLPRDQHLQIAHALWAYDPLVDFASLQVPTLAINTVQGPERDPVVVAATKAALAACETLQIHWMDDTIHDVPWQRPAELAALLRK